MTAQARRFRLVQRSCAANSAAHRGFSVSGPRCLAEVPQRVIAVAAGHPFEDWLPANRLTSRDRPECARKLYPWPASLTRSFRQHSCLQGKACRLRAEPTGTNRQLAYPRARRRQSGRIARWWPPPCPARSFRPRACRPSPVCRSRSWLDADQATLAWVLHLPGNALRATRERVTLNGKMSGGVLLSHAVARAVPSAQKGLASGFGMGPGVSLSL